MALHFCALASSKVRGCPLNKNVHNSSRCCKSNICSTFYWFIIIILSRHPSLSLISSGRSSELHPVSSQSCCMLVRTGRPAFARPYEGVHRSTSLMSSSLLLQQYPACLVRLTLIVFVMGSRWLYSCYFVECCLQDLFNIARSILVKLPSKLSVHTNWK